MSFQDEHRQLGEQIDALCAKRAFAPHCDQWVLHAPGTCWSCDGYPDWQSARLTWGINFTGESDPEKLPCPAELRRPVERINLWGGNRPDAQTIQPVLGEDYSVTVAKHFGVEVSTPIPETRWQFLRRQLSHFVHYHF